MAQYRPGDIVDRYGSSGYGTSGEAVDRDGSDRRIGSSGMLADAGGWARPLAVVAVALAGIVVLAGVAGGSDTAVDSLQSPQPEAVTAPSRAPEPTSTTPDRGSGDRTADGPVFEGLRAPQQQSIAGTAMVSRVIDGDTIEMSDGSRVRIIGIDTPERGECGYEAASDRLATLVLGTPVSLVSGKGEDTDRYDRLLRYVDVGSTDAGEVLLREGLAIPRYNSTDGYGWHPREELYARVAAPPVCRAGALPAGSKQTPSAHTGTGPEPWNQPGPDLDCADIGRRVQITGPDYHRLDRDGDGWACESYG